MRAIIDEVDRLAASHVAKERSEKIVIDQLRQTAAEAAATALDAREAAETALTIERQAREAAEARIADLYASSAWRLTRTLRFARSMLSPRPRH